ncbi:MAG: dTMP kinase [Bacteroidetes bacterium]|jgi:dTMP kinase|nr:MAG: dTMP kinase [Bacteroidota bacterium]
MQKNYFIALEGIDGSGKSTQVKLLSDKLKKEGFKIYTTFEPTDSPIGSVIKNIFRHRIEADHRTIAGLYVADRLDHLLNKTNGILKKMEEGYTVVTDRYYFSSYAYQGTHMSMDWVIQANSLSAELLRPDLTIFIDVQPEVSMQRLSEGRDMIQLYESLENLHNVRSKYMEAFDRLKNEEIVFITDGNRPVDAIANDVWTKVYSLLKPHGTFAAKD